MKITLRGDTQLKHCPDCNSSHLGVVPCGGFLKRMRSVRLDPAATPTRDLKNYYDKETLRGVFPEHAEEEYMEDTEGKGAISRAQILQDPTVADSFLEGAPEVDPD